MRARCPSHQEAAVTQDRTDNFRPRNEARMTRLSNVHIGVIKWHKQYNMELSKVSSNQVFFNFDVQSILSFIVNGRVRWPNTFFILFFYLPNRSFLSFFSFSCSIYRTCLLKRWMWVSKPLHSLLGCCQAEREREREAPPLHTRNRCITWKKIIYHHTAQIATT